MIETIAKINSLMNFRLEYHLEDECILEVIKEYCRKHDLDLDEFAQNLGDYQAFQDMVEEDLIKHKYIKKEFIPKPVVDQFAEFLK